VYVRHGEYIMVLIFCAHQMAVTRSGLIHWSVPDLASWRQLFNFPTSLWFLLPYSSNISFSLIPSYWVLHVNLCLRARIRKARCIGNYPHGC